MKRQALLLFSVAALACSFHSYGDITSARWSEDGDGAIVCGNRTSWTIGAATLSMQGNYYGWPGSPLEPAHMVGTITTSSALDPTLTLASAVENDTSLAWAAYQVNVVMAVPFSFGTTLTVANYPNPTPPDWKPDWSAAILAAPALQTSGTYAGEYEGSLYFSGGTPIQPGDELTLSYAISFSSSTQYSFTQEMIPVPVPEPSSLALLALGGLLCAGWRSRRPQT